MKRLLYAGTALCLAWALPALAQETIQLQVRFSDKQVWTSTEKLVMDIKGTYEEEGQQKGMAIKQERDAQYVETVLASANGKRVKVVRKYLKFAEKMVQNDQAMEKNGPLHGKDVTFEEKEGKIVVLAPTDLPAEAIGELKLSGHWDVLFPDKPVALGHKWTLTPEATRSFFNIKTEEFKEGKLEAVFKEVTTHNGVKAAKIELTATIKGLKTDQQMSMTMELAGPLYISMEGNLPLELNLSGTVTMESAPSKLSIKGPMRFHAVGKLGQGDSKGGGN